MLASHPISAMNMNARDAQDLHSELVERFADWEAILKRNLAAIVRWRYANSLPNPLAPSGPLDRVDFDLWLTDEFVGRKRVFSDSWSNKCFYRLGYDAEDRLRLERDIPMCWEYQTGSTTGFNLSPPFRRACFERAWHEASRLLRRVEVTDTNVTDRYFDYAENLICRVRDYRWKRADSEFVAHPWTRVHNIIYTRTGKLKQIESIWFDNGQEKLRETTNVRHLARR